MPRDDIWTDGELREAARAYLAIQSTPNGPATFSPTAVHRALVNGPLSGRNEAAIGRRMSNISTILKDAGQPFIKRYPASLGHYGGNVGVTILRLLSELRVEAELPTPNPAEAAARARTLMSKGRVPRPTGNAAPRTTIGSRIIYDRSPAVVAWTLQEADGTCEGCEHPAPFISVTGAPYLEVHHVLCLANRGPDTVDNTVALCANCHRRLHHSVDALQFARSLIKKIERLVDHSRIKSPQVSPSY